jgi:lipoate-protein ligase A
MHKIIAAALATLEVKARLHSPVAAEPFQGVLCFQHFTAGDLLIEGAKVVGSAQRKQRGALMQHGGILLAQSPHAPALPGIRELTGRALDHAELCLALEHSFIEHTGWRFLPAEWTPAERQQVKELVQTRYAHDSWNRKR